MSARHWLWVVGLAVAGIALWWLVNHGSTGEHAVSTALDAGAAPRATSVERPALARSLANPLVAGPATRFDPTVQHTADPCTAISEPIVPAEYDSVTAQGITVAWSTADAANLGPYDVPVKPVALAHLVGGLLEEAAQLTGTDRRTQLTVIVDSTRDDFLARNRVPSWVAGLYDGGAVRVYAKLNEDLGVVLSTLRHEVMHAQLHATVGCMPFWLNEGLAMYFAGTPPIREWFGMLRSPATFELASLQEPSIHDLKDEAANRVYALSLAMIVHIIEQAGEPGMRGALQSVRAAGSRPAALEIWERTYPGVGYRVVLESVSHKLFGAPRGELDDIFRGAICCHGLRSVSELGCRGAPARPDESYWSDASVSPRATCRNKW